jgi:peptidoglycan/xylan/chitin deacetylase (PgdA/CDA1 family)
VLGYHRIAEPADDPYGLCTSPARFAQHMRALRREANPVSLFELIETLERKRIPPRSVVVTLDDGYADSLHNAKPILEAFGVQATVFVTSGLLGREPWWDAIARLLSSPAAMAEPIRIGAEGMSLRWVPAAAEDGVDAHHHRIRALHRGLLAWPEQAQRHAIDELEARLAPVRASDARGLDADELRRLAEGDAIEIGAHSVSHSRLADLPETAQRAEIEGSKATLEELISAPVRHFSYPNGSHSALTRTVVRECGFDSACASFDGVVSRDSDRFQLPRSWVGHLEADTLRRWLRRWR